VRVMARTVMLGASAQSTDITACPIRPKSSGLRRPTASDIVGLAGLAGALIESGVHPAPRCT
jgi:hypothetical protein